jgi:hypothetical protein
VTSHFAARMSRDRGSRLGELRLGIRRIFCYGFRRFLVAGKNGKSSSLLWRYPVPFGVSNTDSNSQIIIPVLFLAVRPHEYSTAVLLHAVRRTTL